MAPIRTTIATCALLVASRVPLVASTSIATRYFVPTVTGSVCLDGSPPAYYLYKGAESKKFVIFQRGGGWCTSDSDCASRSESTLGSSKDYPTTVDFDTDPDMVGFGSMSSDPQINPMHYNWTKIFMPYCE